LYAGVAEIRCVNVLGKCWTKDQYLDLSERSIWDSSQMTREKRTWCGAMVKTVTVSLAVLVSLAAVDSDEL
jgi:hypothetical protein